MMSCNALSLRNKLTIFQLILSLNPIRLKTQIASDELRAIISSKSKHLVLQMVHKVVFIPVHITIRTKEEL